MKHSKRRPDARIVAWLAVFVVSFVGLAREAAAAPIATLRVDWEGLANALRDSAGLLGRTHEGQPRIAEQIKSRETADSDADIKWFGLSPHLSLVARDWGGAEALFGHTAVTDQVRLSRSSRMVVSRVRFMDGKLAPFAQLGLGQWRIDTDLMPVLPRDTELAAQIGGGFELRLAKNCAVALELDHTILYREQHEPQMIYSPHLWGTFLAARAVW